MNFPVSNIFSRFEFSFIPLCCFNVCFFLDFLFFLKASFVFFFVFLFILESDFIFGFSSIGIEFRQLKFSCTLSFFKLPYRTSERSCKLWKLLWPEEEESSDQDCN